MNWFLYDMYFCHERVKGGGEENRHFPKSGGRWRAKLVLDGGIPRRENEIERRSWSLSLWKYVMRCTIWYHLHNLKNVKSTQGGMLLLVKLQAKWYQIGQNITNIICEYLQGTLLKRQFTHTFLLHINYSYNHWWIDDELFLWYGWPTKGVWPYFQPGPLSEIFTIANLRHAEQALNLRRTWV